ncbi:hypothetical protein B0T16DRAFT_459198 [Cercophora newfieldiana]|uniref:Uncharacterized protein n=1 Tax=Cercophora newfieldiana TaxID=92897 RepID=A0AA39XZ64_9PEZI|nr:hypothetical protein B0T16DRAFT_459198 [Cercophora newfieldiana]
MAPTEPKSTPTASKSVSERAGTPLPTPTPTPAKKLHQYQRDRQVADLDTEYESKILLLRQRAAAEKAVSVAHIQYQNHKEKYEALFNAQAKSSIGLFRKLERRRFMAAEEIRSERVQLREAFRRECERIDAGVKQREGEIVKEWFRKWRLVYKGEAVARGTGEEGG